MKTGRIMKSLLEDRSHATEVVVRRMGAEDEVEVRRMGAKDEIEAR